MYPNSHPYVTHFHHIGLLGTKGVGYMSQSVAKTEETRINVRTTPAIKRDLEIVARLRGMSVSSLVNSLVVKAIREDKAAEPSAFEPPTPLQRRPKEEEAGR